MRKKPLPKAPKPFDQTVVKSQVTDAALIQRRRDQIVEAAVTLFSTKGFYRTTIQEVAKRAGVSTGLIYQYAETKEDVLLLALMSVMSTFRHELESSHAGDDPLGRLYAALDTYCRVVDQHRSATLLAYRSTMSLPVEYRDYMKQAELATNELIAIRIRACIEANLFGAIDVDFVTDKFVMHAHTWSLKHWRLNRQYTIGEYVDAGFDFFVEALATRAGKAQYKRLLAARIAKVKPAAGKAVA